MVIKGAAKTWLSYVEKTIIKKMVPSPYWNLPDKEYYDFKTSTINIKISYRM